MSPAASSGTGPPATVAHLGIGLRVLLADGHRTFTEVLAARLEMEPRFPVVDVAFTVQHARRLLAARHYDIFMLDPDLDVEASLRLVSTVHDEHPTVVVMVISELEDPHQVIEVLERGVRAWVSKDTPFDGLLLAISEAVLGHTTISTPLLGPVLEELLGRPPGSRLPRSFVDGLSPRQREVLTCLAAGLSRSQIAERLQLSPHTVRTHVQEVLRKAGAHSTLAAIAKAREAGYRGGEVPDPDGRPERWRGGPGDE